MPEGARILMGDTKHGSLQPYSVVALRGTLANMSPGTSAYWDECLHSHSGVLVCSRTGKPYPSSFVYFLCAITPGPLWSRFSLAELAKRHVLQEPGMPPSCQGLSLLLPLPECNASIFTQI
jgi:hypothetical protein